MNQNKDISGVTKTKDYSNITKTKTVAREDFENFKFGPRAPTACRPLTYSMARLRSKFRAAIYRKNLLRTAFVKRL